MAVYRIARRLNVPRGVLEGFIGTEEETGRPVVVKRLLAPWRPAGGLVARLKDTKGVPGLTEYLEVGTSKELLWVVQALVDAEPLRHVMSALAKQSGFIAPNEGLAVVSRVGALLAAMQARPEPVVHGDVCPSTVLLTPDGNVMLADAAFAGGLERSKGGPARAEPFNLAPEQLTQDGSAAGDVFRLGLLLYELAVGHPLFNTQDPTEAQVLCQRYTGLSREAVAQVPEPWRSLMVEMLAVEPIDRPLASTVERALDEAAKRSGWGAPADDIARLFSRAFPERQALAVLARGGGQLLEVTPLTHDGPVAVGDEEPRPSGGFSALPAVPTPPVRSSVSPPPIRSSASPLPVQRPPISPPSPSGAVVGRISTRKMSRRELAAAREADEVPGPPPSPPQRRGDPSAPRDASVGELLVEKGLISRTQLEEAGQQVAVYGGSLADALASIGACDEDAIVVTLAAVTKTPHLSSRKLEVLIPPDEALSKVSLELARQLDLVPLGLKGGTQLVVAMKDPMDMAAQEALKAATGVRSIVAMRAGENAIRRARERFYAQGDEPPDWLERGLTPSRPLPPPATSAPSAPSAQEPPVVTGSLVSQIIGVEVPEATLEEGAGRLVVALLSMLGERGQGALSLASASAGLAARLGAPAAEVERVRFSAVALAVANLHDGRPPFEVPTVGALSNVLGELGWNAVEALVGPWLDWPSKLPSEPAAQALCVVFGFALHANTPRPRQSQLGSALATFKAQYQVPQPLLEALLAELSGSPEGR